MQFIDLQAQYQTMEQEIKQGIEQVLHHGQFIMGPEVKALEQQLAQFVGVKHCITCGNGTDALQLLFMAYGVGQGDAVFCPDVTFIASVEPAMMLGATPVFCDITANTYNLDPASLEQQILAVLVAGELKPKCVVVVDFLGNPADYQVLTAICLKYDLILIEDAAQSFGASYHSQYCGSFGHSAATSFFPAKPLGCYGDGGAVLTNDDHIAQLCRSLQVHGKGNDKYDNIRIGVNSRLDSIQAAVLLVKLKALQDREIEARQRIARRYNEAFGVHFTVPFVENQSQSVYAQYALLAQSQVLRDDVCVSLRAANIPHMIYYPTPQHQLPVFQGLNHYGEIFAQANAYCQCTFSLPMHPYLEEAQQQQIIQAVLATVTQ